MFKRSARFASLIGISLLALNACEPGGNTPSTEESSGQEVSTYTNPLMIRDFADPYVFKDDDGYYYGYATEGPIVRSSDMVSWENVGSVTLPTWGTPGAHIWAPCVQRFGDTYNYYYALSTWGDPNPGVGVMTSDSPSGPFTDLGKLFDSTGSGVANSIDPDVFTDPVSGKTYIFWGSFHGIWAYELDSETGLGILSDEPTCIIQSTDYEAPNMLYANNRYYLFMSAGSCCEGENSTYNVQVYTSDSVLGPYTKSPVGDPSWSGSILHQLPLDRTDDGPAQAVYGPGHSVVVQDGAGDYWLYYHGYYRSGIHTSTRILFMDKLLWTSDGYPYIDGYVPTLTEQEAPEP